MNVVIAIAALLFSAAEPQGEEAAPQDTSAAELLNQFVSQTRASDTSFAPVLPTRTSLQVLATLDSTTAETYLAALRAQYEYKVQGFDHRGQVFRWQFYSSIVIFAVVIFLVLVGLYFSWLQFRRDLAAPESEAAETELAVSTEGIKVQSSVLGVIILVISLLFFYLYLVYVYPIEEIL
ncbi:MAG: hypothetical protein GWN99_13300 [Gemmatimonadetes bacterium]|uniref:Uncharacterized protein n=1 Tax=Candidatus Kutchimonas denitrificans TaxID=3056748 RepID=A0AAE5C9U7_9BACT|nr:hypothetical protein [Gemmatimonadota bacterium]NIR75856.1 hypothetical protein [Candidatus Kutchimonas denitrificans]NIS02023.1 hypothetical protein [Gemmatimonadota bacterium]NIT67827.1 hypothetical protein [Gemmatimonadota bacterium]NIU53814.1 hypothetical protein [Gemmatimonadota bacterium]